MTVKLKYFEQVKVKIERRIKKLEGLIQAKPMTELFKVHDEGRSILKEHKGDYVKIAKLIEPLAAKERKLIKQAKGQARDIPKYIDESIKLQSELADIKGEIFCEKIKLDRLRKRGLL